MKNTRRFFRLAAFSFCIAACVNTTIAQVPSAAFGEYMGGVRMVESSVLNVDDTVPGITLKLTDTLSNYVLRFDSLNMSGAVLPATDMNNIVIDTSGSGYILTRPSGYVTAVIPSIQVPQGIAVVGGMTFNNVSARITLINGRIDGDTLDANFTVSATVYVLIVVPVSLTFNVHFNGIISYDPLAITRINNLIDYNGLSYSKTNHLAWDFATWNAANPKELIRLDVSNQSLSGSASFANLTTLKRLNCGENAITTVDVTGCTNLDTLICNDLPISSLNLSSQGNLKLLDCSLDQFSTLSVGSCTNLQTLNCSGNKLTALNLTGLNSLTDFDGSNQSVNLTLYRNGPSSWLFAIPLNSPSFDSASISYSSGDLKSTSNAVDSTGFTVETNQIGMEVSGTMHFSYQEPPYDSLAVARINALIDNNVLAKTKNAPASWEGDFTQWDYSNPRQLTELYINGKGLTGAANLAGLTGLQILDCGNNSFTQLTLTGCTGLTDLDCSSNNLSALDLTGLTLLTTLDCSNNSLSALDLTGLNSLTTFDGSNQSVNLTLDKITSGIYTLSIPLNSPVFDTTAISHASGILVSTDSTVTSTDFIVETGKIGDQLSGTMYFAYSSLGVLYDSLAVARINDLIDINGLSAVKNYPIGWDGSFTVWDNSNPKQLLEINLYNRGLSGAASFDGLANLQRINCSNNSLTTIDLTGLTALEYLNCSYNTSTLATLDVTDLTNLEEMDCSNNPLTALDVTDLASLQILNCSGNNFTYLSVSGLTNLQSLTCTSGSLTQIDASGAENLQQIDCQNNSLTDLDVSGCDSLKTLYCQNNSLTALDLSGLNSLRQLYCQYNSLEELDLSGLNSLQQLYCTYNNLTVLNVAGLSALQQLYCQYNSLCYLDLTGLNSLSSYNGSFQSVNLTLYNNGAGSYRRDMLLLSPSNLTSGISYSSLGGYLESNDENIASTSFTAQTNKGGMALNGTMYFTYEEPTYDPLAVAKINDMIDNNGLTATKDDPISWSNFAVWSNAATRQLTELHLDGAGLTGTASLAGLIFLKEIELQNNDLDRIDVIGCTNLYALHCENNRLTALDLTTSTGLDIGSCSLFGQSPQLVLTNTNIGEYTLAISLDAPAFDETAITYSGGVLKSTDNTVETTDFTAETGVNGLQLSGTMYFTYTGQVLPPTIITTNADLPNGTVGQTYTAALSADGDEPITWSVIDGSLPTGLSLDGATGVISGTPSAEGNFTFTVEALNNYAADTKELTIRINSVGISNYKLGIINYSVYPNPTTGKITVKCAETLHATSVQVFDVVGRTVGAYRIRPENTETVIDISHLANGMYFLKIDGKILKVVKE